MGEGGKKIFTVLCSCCILTITAFGFIKMYTQHLDNQQVIKECLTDDFTEVVIQKEHFWSPVTCEEKHEHTLQTFDD